MNRRQFAARSLAAVAGAAISQASGYGAAQASPIAPSPGDRSRFGNKTSAFS
jgi:hypothetical protein